MLLLSCSNVHVVIRMLHFCVSPVYIIEAIQKRGSIMRKRKEVAPISHTEKEFFSKFYEENKKFMFYIAQKYAGSYAECEDIVQEAVSRLLCNISTINKLSGYGVQKYISLTIRSVFLDLESQKRREQTILVDNNMLEEFIYPTHSSASSSLDTELGLELEHLKNGLSPRDWMVLEGKYILEYSDDQLADMLGVNPDSIRMILCRAKQNARKIKKGREDP